MYGYIVSRPLTLRTRQQSKHLLPAASFDRPAIGDIQLIAQSEIELLKQQMQAAYPGVLLEQLVKVLTPAGLARWKGLPPYLGRAALHYGQAQGEAVTAQPDDVELLVKQLRALRQAHPNRHHFRLLIVNGFGTNLGDNLIGLTAFRQVHRLLRRELPSVSVDVMLGWSDRDSLVRLLLSFGEVDAVRTQGPTLAELSRYQGIFDTSELLKLPRFGEGPLVDWYLWWMGVPPQSVDETEKLLPMPVRPADQALVAERLRAIDGPRILINPKASVALRSMPAVATQRLIQHPAAALAQRPRFAGSAIRLHPSACPSTS